MNTPYRTTFIDADFRPRLNVTGIQCYRCGKQIKEGSKYRVVHIVDSNSISQLACHKDDEHLAPQNDDWLPIGMDCARKIGMEFTHPQEMWSTEVRSTARAENR